MNSNVQTFIDILKFYTVKNTRYGLEVVLYLVIILKFFLDLDWITPIAIGLCLLVVVMLNSLADIDEFLKLDPNSDKYICNDTNPQIFMSFLVNYLLLVARILCSMVVKFYMFAFILAFFKSMDENFLIQCNKFFKERLAKIKNGARNRKKLKSEMARLAELEKQNADDIDIAETRKNIADAEHATLAEKDKPFEFVWSNVVPMRPIGTLPISVVSGTQYAESKNNCAITTLYLANLVFSCVRRSSDNELRVDHIDPLKMLSFMNVMKPGVVQKLAIVMVVGIVCISCCAIYGMRFKANTVSETRAKFKQVIYFSLFTSVVAMCAMFLLLSFI
jgi:hypothetical protein